MNNTLDPIDHDLLKSMEHKRNSIDRPRVGDYVLFATGELERISHDWDEVMQTAPGGSYFLSRSGGASFSGGLHPAIPVDTFELTKATLPGEFWFFHHGITGAGRGVYADIRCRVYRTSAPYCGYLGRDFQSRRTKALKPELDRQLAEARETHEVVTGPTAQS